MFKSIRSLFLSAILLPAVALHAAKVTGVITNRTLALPIEGVRVIIAGLGGGAGSADTTTTDASGAYSFDGVATGFHSLAASRTGYQANTANVSVVQANGIYAANIILTPTTGGGTGSGHIIGNVKDDATKEVLKGATVILSRPNGRGGSTIVDTTLTDGGGSYEFEGLTAANNYMVEAMATGYNSGSTDSVKVANLQTVTVFLTLVKTPKPVAFIVGHVTDAASKEAIPGATIILRKRTTNGNAWQNLDTIQSGGDGSFKFSDLAPSTQAIPYSLLVSKTDYTDAASGNIVVANTRTDTVDVALTKVAKGSMSIFVGLDSTGNREIVGATVAATSTAASGEIYTGITDAKGWVTFASVIAGSYSVAANQDGFVSKATARTVTANEKDTGFIYLARATAQNSKSLSGLVRDAGGKAVVGSKVLLELNGANGITVATTTSATGDYSFNGIPANAAGGTVTVQKDGFSEFSAPVTLTGAATFLNVTLKVPTSIALLGGNPGRFGIIRNGSALALEFPASKAAGSLSLYDARGALLTAARIPAGAVRADLAAPSRSGAARFLVLKQGSSVQRMSLPPAP